MVKCFKLPVIQASIGFYGILLGSLRYQNRVLLLGKNSIFTIVNIVKRDGKSPRSDGIIYGYAHFGPNVHKCKKGEMDLKTGDPETGKIAGLDDSEALSDFYKKYWG